MEIKLKYKTYPFGNAGDIIEIPDDLACLFNMDSEHPLATEVENPTRCDLSTVDDFFRPIAEIDFDDIDDWNTNASRTMYSIVSSAKDDIGIALKKVTDWENDSETQTAIAEGIYKYQYYLSGYLYRMNVERSVFGKKKKETDSDIDSLIRKKILDLKTNGVEEFGRLHDADPEVIDAWQRILDSRMNEAAKKEAYNIRKRIDNHTISEKEKSLKRLNLILDLPWGKKTEDNLDFEEARKILDDSHYGMEKVKKMILECLVAWSYTDKSDRDAPALCLVGAPGTGKTSIAKDIAKALHRKYGKISLAGVSDILYLNGSTQTWNNADCGEYIRTLKRLGTDNPVILLDEIDKLAVGGGNGGRPLDSLVQILDPEQNKEFTDQFLNIPYDFSDVFFIVTANSLDSVPAPVLDRMEIIQIPSYTEEDKMHIAEEFIIPKIVKSYPHLEGKVGFSMEAVSAAVGADAVYGGVRELERKLEHLYRAALVYLNTNHLKDMTISREQAEQWLEIKPEYDFYAGFSKAGIANGLAVTGAGGGAMQRIETVSIPGDDDLVVTGLAGDVMRESAQIALDYIHSEYKTFRIERKFFDDHTVHVHFPVGAVEKDGPSAGSAIALSVVSCALNIPVPSEIALTGELTLSGRILPVGGIYQKASAASRNGIRTLFLPEGNRQDAEKLPASSKENMDIVFISDFEELYSKVFHTESQAV